MSSIAPEEAVHVSDLDASPARIVGLRRTYVTLLAAGIGMLGVYLSTVVLRLFGVLGMPQPGERWVLRTIKSIAYDHGWIVDYVSIGARYAALFFFLIALLRSCRIGALISTRGGQALMRVSLVMMVVTVIALGFSVITQDLGVRAMQEATVHTLDPFAAGAEQFRELTIMLAVLGAMAVMHAGLSLWVSASTLKAKRLLKEERAKST